MKRQEFVRFPHVLHLLRHGETEWNREERIQGSRNSPLTALGLSQAKQQAAILERTVANIRDFSCYSSPLLRARETARIALGGYPPIIDKRIRELDCGAWEGLTPTERAARDPELAARCATDFDIYGSSPGGEGLDRLEQRLRNFLSDLHEPSTIVSHKVVLIVLRGVLTGRPRSEWPLIEAPQGVVIRVTAETEDILA